MKLHKYVVRYKFKLDPIEIKLHEFYCNSLLIKLVALANMYTVCPESPANK